MKGAQWKVKWGAHGVNGGPWPLIVTPLILHHKAPPSMQQTYDTINYQLQTVYRAHDENVPASSSLWTMCYLMVTIWTWEAGRRSGWGQQLLFQIQATLGKLVRVCVFIRVTFHANQPLWLPLNKRIPMCPCWPSWGYAKLLIGVRTAIVQEQQNCKRSFILICLRQSCKGLWWA